MNFIYRYWMAFAIVVSAWCNGSAQRAVLVEAESFQDKGGWVVDQQFMDVMGSPYLLAHGLGRPVAPARTAVVFPAAGVYHVYARTRDWVAPFGPGQFAVAVNGTRVPVTFGKDTTGAWGWQPGGTVTISNLTARLELIDLSGFEGRCDALLFVPAEGAASFSLPAAPDFAWRRELLGLPRVPPVAGEYDFVVIGGGYAGICAAVSAARQGLRVALIQDRPVLGGNASSEVRVGPIGKLSLPPFPRNSDIMYEVFKVSWRGDAVGGLRPAPNDASLEKWVRSQPNLTVFLNQHVFRVTRQGRRIESVTARHIETSKELVFKGRYFADCTGDGTVGYLAGAESRSGSESHAETGETFAPKSEKRTFMGATNFWTTRWTDAPAPFPACPWALAISEESAVVSALEHDSGTKARPPYVACWNWESGFSQDQIQEAESIRDHNFRAIYGTWDYLKNKSAKRDRYRMAEIEWVAYVLGKRESRRLIGDFILTERDLTEHRLYPDGCVTTTWYLDLHYPHPENTEHFPGQEFRSLAYDDPNFEKYRGDIRGKYVQIEPYPIPFRCFYSKNVDNLFMAGRNISVTHVALASIRVMNTTGMMGAMVGRAAYLCRKNNCPPRELYAQHLDELKELLANPGERLPLSVSGEKQMQNRDTLWKELKYRIRACLRVVKRFALWLWALVA